MIWTPIKRYLDYIFGTDVRSFREAWQDRAWDIVIPSIIANVVAISCLIGLWFVFAIGTIHVLDWLGWMP